MLTSNVHKDFATVKGEIASEPRNSTQKKKQVRIDKAERLNRIALMDSALQPKEVGIEYRVEEAANPTDGKWIGTSISPEQEEI